MDICPERVFQVWFPHACLTLDHAWVQCVYYWVNTVMELFYFYRLHAPEELVQKEVAVKMNGSRK